MKRLILLLFFIVALSASVLEAAYSPRLVKIRNEAEADSLSEAGVDILRRRGDILLCLFPDKEKEATPAMRPRRIAPALDKAKDFYEAFSVQSGAAVGYPLTGKGVVVGICDLGIDPLHPTFLDSDGRSRIKRIVQYREREGRIVRLEGDASYDKWQTDSVDEFHATHVCGILAGGGAGSPYQGIASDADIVVTTSSLSEVGLLAGVEDIIDYAIETGKPAVINISVGSYTGPHDGSSLFSQYLDMCADDAIIVLSAGNEGHRTNYLECDFSESRSSVSFRLGDKTWLQKKMYGATDIWSGSSAPLEVALSLFDDQEKRIVTEFARFTLIQGEADHWYWSSEASGTTYDEQSDSLASLPFHGWIYAEGEIDSENGRHRTVIAYDFESPVLSDDKGWSRYNIAVEVRGEPGGDVEVYSDGSYTRLIAMSGQPAPHYHSEYDNKQNQCHHIQSILPAIYS